MLRKKIVVLRGGPSSEYDVSLKTGAEILKNLSDDKYDLSDVCITREGDWYCRGVQAKPAEILSRVDVVVNAMHGEYGEDGKVQRILDTFDVPYTGSRSIPSAVAMNKMLAKQEFKKEGIKVPIDVVLKKGDYDVAEVFRTFPIPAIVKPVNAGSSVGIGLARTAVELQRAIENAFVVSDKILVEEYIDGKEATCGVIDNFRGEEVYTLLPVEIRPKSTNSFFDYDAKYSGESEEICPGNFTNEEKVQIQRLAKQAHQTLGLRHYSRSDFIISPRRGIYLLETNSLPGLTANSLLPKSLNAVGCSLSDFLDHLVELAGK
ncbi:MAG: D-alanine--D-alanine ligase [Patescibacteria group bacterium]|nr:D-alanine--D-alanine ligase [Patescibacteria group bacterium]